MRMTWSGKLHAAGEFIGFSATQAQERVLPSTPIAAPNGSPWGRDVARPPNKLLACCRIATLAVASELRLRVSNLPRPVCRTRSTVEPWLTPQCPHRGPGKRMQRGETREVAYRCGPG